MVEEKNVDILDFVIFLLRWKTVLLAFTVIVFAISYTFIFFFIKPQYESTALIIPSTQMDGGEIGALLKNFSGLPMMLSGLKKNSSADFYKTIIYSRNTIDSVLDKFDLISEYKAKTRELALNTLTSRIFADEAKEGGGFLITARGSSPQQAADITNFIVQLLNKTIIRLNVQKTRDNRTFLEARYNQLKQDLKTAEDSLREFQHKTGLYEANEILRTSIDAYARMESEIAVKEIESGVMGNIYGKSSPQANQADFLRKEYQNKFEELKKGKSGGQILVPLTSIPDKMLTYYRLYRNIKINSSMMEYILPIFEQIKFEEQKAIPILQVIDNAVPSEKRASPKRVVTSGGISIILLVMTIIFLYIREKFQQSLNPKVLLIKNLTKFKNK